MIGCFVLSSNFEPMNDAIDAAAMLSLRRAHVQSLPHRLAAVATAFFFAAAFRTSARRCLLQASSGARECVGDADESTIDQPR